jgi:phosphoserine phosphatase RsbX
VAAVSTQVARAKPAILLDWGVAVRARAGESECGDGHVVRVLPAGVLLAAIDGLGHGREAAAAAGHAARILEEHADEELAALVGRCHRALAGGRGAVLTLARLDTSGAMSWLGVGNVEGVLVRAGEGRFRREAQLLLRGGVVGLQLPPLRPASLRVRRGDVLALATDGVRPGFAKLLSAPRSPQELADEVLGAHGKSSDDALVLVARVGGAPR